MKFSEILIKERKIRGLSQEALAQKLNISRQSISKWENDEAYPDLPKLVLLSNILELSLDSLCGNTDVTSYKVNKKNNYWLALILIPIVICSFTLGRLLNLKSNGVLSDIQFLDFKIIYEQIDDSFHLEFVPNIIDENITYEVELIHNNNSKYYQTNRVGSMYKAVCKAQFPAGPYHLNIIIKSVYDSKTIPITTDLYGAGSHTRYTPLYKN